VHRRISELEHLRTRVSELEAALERIGDHEHCDARAKSEGDLLPGYRVTMDEPELTTLCVGIAAGHRCCSAIAAEALRGKK
jgi:hypothetical protein